MPANPFRASCIPGCGELVTVRGRCAVHAAQRDAQRSLRSDRHHAHLYASVRWQRLRRQILTEHPFCQCHECGGQVFYPPATVVHHVKAHGGDEARFFDAENLQALAKGCHDRITGRNARGSI
jgi:5-methylcytosine-specific restriction enzyme A